MNRSQGNADGRVVTELRGKVFLIEDAKEGVQSFIEKRAGRFTGR